MIWLWPSAQHIDIPLPMQNGGGGAVHSEAGTVVKQDLGPCGDVSNGKVFTVEPELLPAAQRQCERSVVAIDSGADKGSWTIFVNSPTPDQPNLNVGDKIRIVPQTVPKTPQDPNGVTIYSFDDFARGLPLSIIGIVFAVVIIAVARWRGLRALIGLVIAFGVLVMFLLPALLDGKPAIPVALVAGAVILYSVLYLAHGVNLRTSSALLGTLTSMVLAAALSWASLKVTHLTGLSEEQNTNVAAYIQHVSITGLLLAGFIIGSLGVLNDVTITQASAAFELASLDEKANRRSIFAAAMRVGRDHIASTVYTLVLAYAGGALPLLLLFSVAGRPMRDVLTGDAVGIEIARSAVGGIALALSVPLTTAIAVLLARPLGAKPEPAGARGKRPRNAGPQRNPQRRPGGQPGAPRPGAQPAARRAGQARTGEQSVAPRTGPQLVVRHGGDPNGPRTGSQPVMRGPVDQGSGPRTGEQRVAPRTGSHPVAPGDGEPPTVPRTGVVQPNPNPPEERQYTTSSWFNPSEPWSDQEPRDQGWSSGQGWQQDQGWPPSEPPRGGRHSRP
ncbi:hypothetical protein GLP40_18725 [Nocardia sp. CT2-14]|uniref:YibE/F family protein n=1 Tax=Nocardia aurantiaca TaxID=2675850 RepID=A0A6I3KVF8_9NOCA|nr:hypothetical protein [Nocardia aurantiaca]